MRQLPPPTFHSPACVLQSLPDRELLAASQTLSTIAFTMIAAEGLCDRTTSRLVSRHYGELILIGAATGMSFDLLRDDAKVHAEVARRANATLSRFRLLREMPAQASDLPTAS